MNRPIKFRAWDYTHSKMNYGVVPWIARIKTENTQQEVPMVATVFSEKGDGTDLSLYLEPNHSDIMQFTGLTDKNGKEIFGGDVVYLAGYGNYEVKWPFRELFDAAMEGDIGEIKGNVYENPELLK